MLHILLSVHLPQELLVDFYLATIKSLLIYAAQCGSYSSCTGEDLRDLQRWVKAAQQVISPTLPPLKANYTG